MMKAAAEFLGLDRRASSAQQLPGNSLAALAEKQGKSVERARRLRWSPRLRNDSRKAVANGKITQARADAALERLETLADKLAEKVFADEVTPERTRYATGLCEGPVVFLEPFLASLTGALSGRRDWMQMPVTSLRRLPSIRRPAHAGLRCAMARPATPRGARQPREARRPCPCAPT